MDEKDRPGAMTALRQYLGVALVVAGALLLIASYLMGWTDSNIVLLTGLIVIVLGVALHVKQQKKGEKY